jgi:outer membrane protein assembly factor BamB
MGKRYKKPQYYKAKKKKRLGVKLLLVVFVIAALLAGAYLINLSIDRFKDIRKRPSENVHLDVPPTPAVLSDNEGYLEEEFVENPIAFEYSDPKNFAFETYIMDAGNIVKKFDREQPIRFNELSSYTKLNGITTYKGDNYRSSACFGTARITNAQMKIEWTKKLDNFEIIGPFDGTAQPLVIRWTADMMDIVKFKYGKKDKVQLTEVIFADKSAKVYFLDLDDGQPSRAVMPTIAYTEGTPTLDPRGYPLLYIGQSIQEDGNTTKSRYNFFYIYDLIRQKETFRFGSSSVEPFSDSKWQGYTTSPLIDDDTIMIPAESGILYTFKLGAVFDKKQGKVSVNTEPALVKYKYENIYTGYAKDHLDEEGIREPREINSGTTGSLAAFKNYLFFSEKSGFLQCVDANTMQLIYMVELKGSGDFTLSIDEADNIQDGFYVYSGTRLDFAKAVSEDEIVEADGTSDPIYFRKIDGRTGKILWENQYQCNSSVNARGGVIKSAVIGKNDLSEFIIYAISGVEGGKNTRLVCVRKIDGTIKWEREFLTQGKSAPVEMYDKHGQGYILLTGLDGKVNLIEGHSGEVLRQVSLEAGADGDPVVYGNKMIVHLENDTLVCVSVK